MDLDGEGNFPFNLLEVRQLLARQLSPDVVDTKNQNNFRRLDIDSCVTNNKNTIEITITLRTRPGWGRLCLPLRSFGARQKRPRHL